MVFFWAFLEKSSKTNDVEKKLFIEFIINFESLPQNYPTYDIF